MDGDEHELEIRALHDMTFGDEAPQVDPTEGWWWIAYHGITAVAFAGMRQSLQWIDAMYMHRSGVLPWHRGHGLQRRLIRVREAKARKIGFAYLVSDTTDNIESANNLIRCGFRLYKPTVRYGFSNTNYWSKFIAGHRKASGGVQEQRAAHSGDAYEHRNGNASDHRSTQGAYRCGACEACGDHCLCSALKA